MSNPTWVLIPISTIGCGKLTLFRALTKLYPNFAHVENDRMENKRAFMAKLQSAVKRNRVVLVDRNNHMMNHRKELVKCFEGCNVNLVLVNFINPRMNLNEVKNIVRTRLKARGNNHPTVDGNDGRMVAMVVNSFFRDFRLYDSSEEWVYFDSFIDLDMAQTPYRNLELLMDFFVREAGYPHPDPARARQVLQSVMAYKVPDEEKKFKKAKVETYKKARNNVANSEAGREKVQRWQNERKTRA